MKACFTGHRYINHSQVNVKAINHLINQALEMGVTEFYNGMAIGTDLLAAKLLNQRNLPWIAVIPCQDQTAKWPTYLQQEHNWIRSQATSEVILANKYFPTCMAIRNQFMVNNSDILLSIYDELNQSGSGTKLTVNMAKKKGLIIFNYNPKTDQFSDYLPKQQLTLF